MNDTTPPSQLRDEPNSEEAEQTCVAVRYGDRSLCGCMNCVEYTADRLSEGWEE